MERSVNPLTAFVRCVNNYRSVTRSGQRVCFETTSSLALLCVALAGVLLTPLLGRWPVVRADAIAETFPFISSELCNMMPVEEARSFVSPLRPKNGTEWLVTRGFGELVDRTCPGFGFLPATSDFWHHTGVDYALDGLTSASSGEPVYAAANGVVIFAGAHPSHPRNGALVVVKHVRSNGFVLPGFGDRTYESFGDTCSGPSGFSYRVPSFGQNFNFPTSAIYSYYLHLDPDTLTVSVGDNVAAGQHIGSIASATQLDLPPNLHFEIWGTCPDRDPNRYDTPAQLSDRSRFLAPLYVDPELALGSLTMIREVGDPIDVSGDSIFFPSGFICPLASLLPNSNEILALWRGSDLLTGFSLIGRRFGWDGLPVGSEFVVATDGDTAGSYANISFDYDVTVADQPGDRFVVAWTRNPGTPSIGPPTFVVARSLDASGQMHGEVQLPGGRLSDLATLDDGTVALSVRNAVSLLSPDLSRQSGVLDLGAGDTSLPLVNRPVELAALSGGRLVVAHASADNVRLELSVINANAVELANTSILPPPPTFLNEPIVFHVDVTPDDVVIVSWARTQRFFGPLSPPPVFFGQRFDDSLVPLDDPVEHTVPGPLRPDATTTYGAALGQGFRLGVAEFGASRFQAVFSAGLLDQTDAEVAFLPWAGLIQCRPVRQGVSIASDHMRRFVVLSQQHTVLLQRYEVSLPNDDDDQDTFSNAKDLCPDTPIGEVVDPNGCACSQKSCNDADVCTVDTCRSADASCVSTLTGECCAVDADCDDTDDCTVDHCDAAAKTCVYATDPVCQTCQGSADPICSSAMPDCPAASCDLSSALCFCPDPDNGIHYAALGDSYSSGEGVPPYEAGTDTEADRCHRSTAAYSTLVRAAGTRLPLKFLSDISTSADAFDWRFHACSGAVTEDVSLFCSKGPGVDVDIWSCPPQRKEVGIDETTDLVTLTIGGNDAYFSKLITFCFLQVDCQNDDAADLFGGPATAKGQTLRDWAIATIHGLRSKLDRTYRSVQLSAPNAAVLALGYPRLVGKTVCPDVQIKGSLQLDAGELAFIRDLADQLNVVIGDAAADSGIQFVDVEKYFDLHEVCDSEPYIHGLIGLAGANRVESFHPNEQGQRQYAMAVNDYLQSRLDSGWKYGFSIEGLPRNPPPGATQGTPRALTQALDQPAFRLGDLQIEAARQSACSQVSVYDPGEEVRIQGAGFMPNSDVSLRLVSETTILDLGTAISSDDGSLAMAVAIPSEAEIGALATMSAIGMDLEGTVFALTAFLKISDSGGDTDGDGIRDDCDDCVSVSNNGQTDSDGDGIGDACDPCPSDFENDWDGDGLCANDDPCPADVNNDIDRDGLCSVDDNCPRLANPLQGDVNGNGIGDLCDGRCAKCQCGQPVTSGVGPVATDCLFILQSAVGSRTCEPACKCATKGTLPVVATDALLCLRKAVGQSVGFLCPC